MGASRHNTSRGVGRVYLNLERLRIKEAQQVILQTQPINCERIH